MFMIRPSSKRRGRWRQLAAQCSSANRRTVGTCPLSTFSNQNRSASLRRRNCSRMTVVNREPRPSGVDSSRPAGYASIATRLLLYTLRRRFSTYTNTHCSALLHSVSITFRYQVYLGCRRSKIILKSVDFQSYSKIKRVAKGEVLFTYMVFRCLLAQRVAQLGYCCGNVAGRLDGWMSKRLNLS